jgi:hypothetical protein
LDATSAMEATALHLLTLRLLCGSLKESLSTRPVQPPGFTSKIL